MATLHINDTDYNVQIEPHWTLREALQYAVGLTGNAKEMCGRGACGSCSVLMDGDVVLSCSTLACECIGHDIHTVEGLTNDPTWQPLVDAYVKYDTAQCGYCNPGMFIVAAHLLMNNSNPSEDDIRTAFSGNICRCGTYMRHIKAIQEAAPQINLNN
jgi:aerobic-type carbon monoxide dehydrogenase small subunit (CoxS/CutS family)